MVARGHQRPFFRRNSSNAGLFIPQSLWILFYWNLIWLFLLMTRIYYNHALTNLCNRICEILDKIIINPSIFESGQLEQVRPVGSFKMGTWLNGSCTADLACVFRTLPTLEAVQNLANFVRNQLTTNKSPTERLYCQTFNHHYANKLNKTTPDIHINLVAQKTALASIRHLRWAEENATHTTVKVLIRILKDFRRRFRAFSYMNSWLIDLLGYYAVMNNPSRQPLPLNHAFRRVLYLLASGFLLPGSTGLIDPCEPGYMRVHSFMTPVEQDEICCTAQVMLRVLIHGGYALLFMHSDLDDASRDQLLKAASELDNLGDIDWPEPVALPLQTVENGVGLIEWPMA
ncbi:unnamed protein product [Heterobilharzia americana]|nr:unnamed protein product [Heterobilharzia americana]